jgi:IS30 family transposase
MSRGGRRAAIHRVLQNAGVERQSRFVIIVKVNDKRTEAVVAALIKAVRKWPAALRQSMADRTVQHLLVHDAAHQMRW